MKHELRRLFDRFNVWLTVELANICNLRCSMCQVRRYDPLVPGLMEREIFERLMAELVAEDLRIYGLKLFWLGEPLLHPEFSEFLQCIPARQVNETVVFDTNCLLMDDEVIEAIIRRCRDCKVYIFLSLDGISDASYEKMRVGGNRARAYANVHRLLQRRQEEGLSFPRVRLQFIVHPHNRQEAGAFIRYWRSQPYYSELPVMDAVQDDRDFIHLRRWISGDEQALADRIYQETLAELGIARETMPANLDQRDCHTGDFPCENLFAMPMVRASGDVTVCNNDVELALKLGNLKEQSFLDVWCGPQANRLRALHLSGCRDQIAKCASCQAAQRTYFPDALEEMAALLCGNGAEGGSQ